MTNLQSYHNTGLINVVSINQLCSMLSISRSRFYQLLSSGFLLPPIYSLDNKRPFYTPQMAEINLAVKRNNVGINGKICIFYNSRSLVSTPIVREKSLPNKPAENVNSKKMTDIMDGLSSLGITEAKPAQIRRGIKQCFPDGIENVDEGEVLKAVFCLIKEQNTRDNVDR